MRYDVYVTYMKYVNNVTQLAYVQKVMMMLIDLNVDLCYLTFYPSSAKAN